MIPGRVRCASGSCEPGELSVDSAQDRLLGLASPLLAGGGYLVDLAAGVRLGPGHADELVQSVEQIEVAVGDQGRGDALAGALLLRVEFGA